MRARSVPLCWPLCAGVVAGGLRQRCASAAGLTKKSPDEFAVTTKAPLVIPPDFNLRPPMPGARAAQPGRRPPTAPQAALFTAPIRRPWPAA